MSKLIYEGTTQAPRNPRVLIVEDNAIQQMILGLQLKRLGVEFDTAVNGAEAFLATGRFPYSLVIMDCHMPEMDGIEATASIRRREQTSGCRVPIVGYSVDARRQDCLDAGMDEFLQKPGNNTEVGDMVARYLPLLESDTAHLLPALNA